MLYDNNTSKTEFLFEKKGVSVYVKREDLLHKHVSGNKFRKLKYNLFEAKKQEKNTILTFGGAYSNHIVATAYAGKLFNFQTIGVIRGEELSVNLKRTLATNPSLKFASEQGMQFYFVSRSDYREKNQPSFIEKLKNKFGDFYLVPEGGTNNLAIKGCEEILNDEDDKFHYICSAIGTGGTISGLINSAKAHQKIVGFPALKGNFHHKEIKKYCVNKSNWELIDDYHFGGFAKINEELVSFINKIKRNYGLALDPIYTGKMLFGIEDLIQKDYFKKGTKILAVHTGGLQGIKAMNIRLKKKGLELIDL